MKNLHLVYQAIKEVEDNTLFKFECVDEENELHFSYYKEDYRMIISSESIYIDPQESSVLISYKEMCVLMKLMSILKEFN